jgi:hypothetical protein
VRLGRQCPTGKQWSYVTAADALFDLVRIQREIRQRDPDGKIPDRAYDCDLCGFWHVTSADRER